MATSKATKKVVGKERQPKNEPEIEQKNGSKSALSVSCSVCGKPLTDAESVEAGIGPVCMHKGWTPGQIAERMEELTLKKAPDQKYIALSEVVRAAQAVGISPSRVVRAIGGDRGMNAPLNAVWTPRYWNGKRYLVQKVLSQLDDLREMGGRENRKKAPAQEVKASKKVKAEPKAEPKPEPVAAPRSMPKLSTTRSKPTTPAAKAPAAKPAAKGGKKTERGFGYVPPKKVEQNVDENGLPVIDL